MSTLANQKGRLTPGVLQVVKQRAQDSDLCRLMDESAFPGGGEHLYATYEREQWSGVFEEMIALFQEGNLDGPVAWRALEEVFLYSTSRFYLHRCFYWPANPSKGDNEAGLAPHPAASHYFISARADARWCPRHSGAARAWTNRPKKWKIKPGGYVEHRGRAKRS